jgi:hypothetical protein
MKKILFSFLILGIGKAKAQTDTTTHPFIVLPANFVTKYQNYKSGVNQFYSVKTADNRWVVSLNALYEFSPLLSEINITPSNVQVVRLKRSDFAVAGGTTTSTTN